jgi:phospholipid/cholesterol/gamma-HCH transport system permease protein
MAKTLEALSFFEVCWGLAKSLVFAVIIVMVGCFRGFTTRGGADAVGNAATSAVVTSIFFIILLDSVFAVARSYW